eukprot:gene9748-7623_t
MKVAVVGAGSVGTTLAQRLSQKNFRIKFGVRDPSSEKTREMMSKNSYASVDKIPEAVAWADAVILATPSFHEDEGIQKVAQSLGPGIKVSGEIASKRNFFLPDVFVAKAFNTCGLAVLGHPFASDSSPLTMLIAGAAEGKEATEELVAGVGFTPQYVGPIRYARNLEGYGPPRAVDSTWPVHPAGFHT